MRRWDEVFKEERERYRRYSQYLASCFDLTECSNKDVLRAEIYCEGWDSFIDGGLQRYETVAKLCKEHGITKVYDIGCNIGLQSKVFAEYGISYVGVDLFEESIKMAPHGKGVSYIHAAYPFSIQVEDKAHTAAVSELCVGYLAVGEKVWEQIASDFDYYAGLPGPGENGMDKELFKENFRVVGSVLSEGLPCYFAENQRVKEKSVDVEVPEIDFSSFSLRSVGIRQGKDTGRI